MVGINGLKHDLSATIVSRAVSSYSCLPGYGSVHVHIPRIENTWAEVADSLYRGKTSLKSVFAILGEDPEKQVKGAMEDWVGNPMENWELPELLLKEVKDWLQLK
jgi:hypothetical protein